MDQDDAYKSYRLFMYIIILLGLGVYHAGDIRAALDEMFGSNQTVHVVHPAPQVEQAPTGISEYDHAQKVSVKVKGPSERFIDACFGGVVASSEVRLMAVSECVGRVHGFIEAHNLMYTANKQETGHSVQLFCVDSSTPPDQLVTTIMDWVDSHTTEFAKIEATAGDDVAPVTIIAALKDAYPCGKRM